MIRRTHAGVVITDDADASREPLVLPLSATPAEIEAAALAYLPSPVPEPQWLGFLAAVQTQPVVSEAIGDGLSAMMQPRPAPEHQPFVALGLGVGLGQAADSGDARVFLQAWRQALALGAISPTVVGEVQALAVAYYLPDDFVQGLGG